MESLTWEFVPEEIRTYYEDRADKIFRLSQDKIVVTTLVNEVGTWESDSNGKFVLTSSKPSVVVPERKGLITITFYYGNGRNDPNPIVVYLGQYIHERTGNQILCGVNLNYVDPSDKDLTLLVLRKTVEEFASVPERVNWLRYQWGKDFHQLYRDYLVDLIENVQILP